MNQAIPLVLALLIPLASAGPLDDAQPPAAIAIQTSPDTVLVAWAPAPGNAEGYLVYGVDEGVLTPLAAVPSTASQAEVPAGHAAYKVASAADPEGGASVVGVISGEPCIYIGTVPPSITIDDLLHCLPAH